MILQTANRVERLGSKSTGFEPAHLTLPGVPSGTGRRQLYVNDV